LAELPSESDHTSLKTPCPSWKPPNRTSRSRAASSARGRDGRAGGSSAAQAPSASPRAKAGRMSPRETMSNANRKRMEAAAKRRVGGMARPSDVTRWPSVHGSRGSCQWVAAPAARLALARPASALTLEGIDGQCPTFLHARTRLLQARPPCERSALGFEPRGPGWAAPLSPAGRDARVELGHGFGGSGPRSLDGTALESGT